MHTLIARRSPREFAWLRTELGKNYRHWRQSNESAMLLTERCAWHPSADGKRPPWFSNCKP